MKQYEVALIGHFGKTVSTYADSPGQAAEKLKIILFNTGLIRFFDGDSVCGGANIKDENEDGCEEMESEGGDFENEDCSDYPYFCPVYGECIYEGEDQRHVLPNTEFGYPSADGNKIRLLGDTPNIPWKRPLPEGGR